MSRLVLAAPSKARAARPIPTITAYSGPVIKYNQIKGIPLSMALLDNDYKEVMAPVMCKDYISDAIWSETTGNEVTNMYGLRWTPGTLPKGQYTYLGLRFDNPDQAKKSTNIAALLGVWNKALGFECDLLDTTNPLEKILRIDGNWTDQPIRISMLLLTVRIGIAYHPDESLKTFFDEFGFDEALLWKSRIGEVVNSKRAEDVLSSGDPPMVYRAKERMLRIEASGKFPEQTWEQYETVRGVHSSSGIVSFDEDAAGTARTQAEARTVVKQMAKAYYATSL